MEKKCNICKQNFNLTNKMPIVINQCFCTHCLECEEDLTRGNDERKIFCLGCQQSCTLPQELNENLQIMKELKSFDQLTVVCDEHLSKTITFYCLNCNIPVCSDCQFTTHKDHLLTELNQSKFKVYTTNVKSIFDEYSVQNMQFQLDNQATNEIQQKASQFQSMVSKVSRMLGHLADGEETSEIDLPTCLGEAQNDPQNMKKNENMLYQCEISLQDIKHLINESQSLLREEFKQALDGYESSLTIKEIIQTDQMDLIINNVQSNFDQQIQQFKQDINTGLEIRPNKFVAEGNLEQKLKSIDQNYIQLKQQLNEINGVILIECKRLNDQIAEINAKTDSIKQFTKDQINLFANQVLEFQQQIQQQEENPNIVNAVDQMKQDFRILVDKEINKSNYSFLGPQLIKGGIDKKFNLLFRGSTHGFTASQFHELCDNKGSTITFVLNEFGQVFGGYASLSWTSTHQYCSDPSAFVFSLSKRSIHQQYQKQEYAVGHFKNYMCLFGGGNDIHIVDQCVQNSESFSNLGYIYEPPKGYKFQSNEARSYFGAQKQFKVLEIEVYSLI
eukprot:403361438